MKFLLVSAVLVTICAGVLSAPVGEEDVQLVRWRNDQGRPDGGYLYT